MSNLLECNFLGTKIKNPLVLASGIIGVTKASVAQAAENGAGAVTIKSLSLELRKGHETPIMVETPDGFLNAVGYSNPGIEAGLKEFSGWERKEALVLSITGRNPDEFLSLAKKIQEKIDSGEVKCAAVEAVLSCPHTPEFGLMAGQQTPETAKEIGRNLKSTLSVPFIMKISPSVPGEVGVAKAIEEAGASAVNVGNTVGPGMVIDIERRSPVLSFKMGGLSGPALRPLTVRSIYDIYKVVKIPIIGTGGVTCGKDAIELMQAGASYIGIGTAVYYRGIEVFGEVANEMETWLKDHKASINDIIGAAHGK